jgi:hypothetical protein
VTLVNGLFGSFFLAVGAPAGNTTLGKDTQRTEEPSMMPAPLTALEQRLFERLGAAMMEGTVDGEREQAAMLVAVNEERSRLGKAPVLRERRPRSRAACAGACRLPLSVRQTRR